MSKTPERKESRKGLIAFTRENVNFEIEETEPGTIVLKAQDPREMIRSLMGALKEIADDAISATGKDPATWPAIKRESDDADPAYVAARLLNDLWRIQNAVNAVARAKDTEAAQRNAYDAVQAALAACFDYHALAICENELDIVVGSQRAEGASMGGRAKAERIADAQAVRNMAMAREFLRRRAKSNGKIDTSLKQDVGSKWKPPLKRTAAIKAINDGLEHLHKLKKVSGLPSHYGE